MARHIPLKQLNEFLHEHKLIKESSLKDFANLRVGIDLATWIKTIKLPVLESFQPAMGGIPISFKNAILSSIIKWTNLNITPLFVFQGLSILRDKSLPLSFGNESRSISRKLAWEQYINSKIKGNIINDVFRDDNLMNFMRSLFPIFIEENIEYIVSPYLSSTQLAWFNENNIIDIIFGGLDLLPYCSNISKLIISVNMQNETCTWINPKEILTILDINSNQFRDIYLLCIFSPRSTLYENMELLKQYGKGLNVLKRHYKASGNKVKAFLKEKAVLSFSPILNSTCQCEPFASDRVPNDLQELFGPRLPSDIYFCLSQGVISTQGINPLLQGELIERPPLLDSQEYHTILNELIEIRAKTLALLIYPLHYQFANREVKTIRWFDREYKSLDLSQHYNRISDLKWNFTTEIFEKEQQRQSGSTMNMSFIVKFLLHNSNNTSLPKSPSLKESYVSEDQIIGQVFTHLFSLLGLLDSEIEKKAYMRALSFVSPINVPHAIIVLKLLHYNTLSGNILTFTDLKDLPLTTENPSILLISRILSILPMNFKPLSAWQSTVDHDLLAFNCILKAVNRSIRNLLEMTLVSVLIRTKIELHHKYFVKISQRLPFYQENNTALGIVVKEFLLDEKPSNSSIIEKYSCCSSPIEDLKKGIQFWNEIVLMVDELVNQNLISNSSIGQFKTADKLLKEKISYLK